MQTHGQKIHNLLKHKGIKFLTFAEKIGFSEAGFIRKKNSGNDFLPPELRIAARELGVTVEFLDDKERVYLAKDPIPEDALVKDTPNLSSLEAMIKHNELFVAAQTEVLQKLLTPLIDLTDRVSRLEKKVEQIEEEGALGGHDPD